PICEMPDPEPLAEESLLRQLDSTDPESIEFLAGEVEALLSQGGGARMSGGVLVRRGDRLAGADSAIYDPDGRALLLRGDVRYEGRGSSVVGESAEFAYESGIIRFAGAEFRLGAGQSRGAAKSLEIRRDGTLELDDVSYTTCPPGSDDWLLEAGDIDIDTES